MFRELTINLSSPKDSDRIYKLKYRRVGSPIDVENLILKIRGLPYISWNGVEDVVGIKQESFEEIVW